MKKNDSGGDSGLKARLKWQYYNQNIKIKRIEDIRLEFKTKQLSGLLACNAPPLQKKNKNKNKKNPLHTLTKTKLWQKLQPTLLRPHQWAQRAEKRREGPRTKVHCDPGPLSSFVLKNGEVQEQLLLAAQDIWDGPFHPKQSLELWVCRLQSCRGEEEEWSRIQNERHTLPDQHGAVGPVSDISWLAKLCLLG